ncbi:RidA family protein [Bryobacter aggregatus]|uniref:RidA family protein n=1 Tax=Bryobacter aggregatus TaxID=360054 RepID=UPI0009B5AEA1|nr:RidA family protein [Bryobacter aggregatus]
MISWLLATALLAQHQYPKSAALPPANGYSHVVVAAPGKMVFLAGQVALDREGKLVGKDDLKAQTEKVFENLKTALASAGADFSHVVKVNWYVKNFQPSQVPVIREVRNRYFDLKNPPASTLVGVSELFMADVLIEVEVTAVIPEKAGKS